MIKYELDWMIVSQRMFHHYHSFPIAKEAIEGCNLMVRTGKEGKRPAGQCEEIAREIREGNRI